MGTLFLAKDAIQSGKQATERSLAMLKSMKSKVVRFIGLCLLSLFLVTACQGQKFLTTRQEVPPLRIGYNLWPGSFPIAIAQEKGIFADHRVNVESVYTINYLESISNFVAGKSDAVFIVLGSFVSLVEKVPDAQILLVSDESAGADVVLAQPNIQSAVDLKGKRLGVKLGDYGELFVTTWLEEHGLNANDVALVNVEGENVLAHLESDQIQAGQTWEPYVSQGVKTGAKILFTSEQTPGLMPSVIVFRGNVIRDRPEQIQAFLRAWFEAQDYWQAHPEECQSLLIQALNLKPEDIFTEGIKFYNLEDNLKAFIPGSTTESLHYSSQLYADFYIRRGGLNAAPDIEKLINPTFVQQLKSKS